MDIKCYLAMTAAEFSAADTLPKHIAWMACHFSCYGTGLSNVPRKLPEGTMIIVNDRTPPHGHDPKLIATQLRQLIEQQNVPCILLDFQRPGMEENTEIVQVLIRELPCPVGVSEHYAQGMACPVFLPPPPPHCRLAAHLAPWSGREIWLEAATEAEIATVTDAGCQFSSTANTFLAEPSFTEDALHSRYHIDLLEDRAVFTLQRTEQELRSLLEEAGSLGVVQAVGLYQQLGSGFPSKPIDR